jgi:hypothetical protein
MGYREEKFEANIDVTLDDVQAKKVLKELQGDIAKTTTALMELSSVGGNLFPDKSIGKNFKKTILDMLSLVSTLGDKLKSGTGSDMASIFSEVAVSIASVNSAMSVMSKTITKQMEQTTKLDKYQRVSSAERLSALRKEQAIQSTITSEIVKVNNILTNKKAFISTTEISNLTAYLGKLNSMKASIEAFPGTNLVSSLSTSGLRNFSIEMDKTNVKFITLKNTVKSIMDTTSSFNTTGMVAQIKSSMKAIDAADMAILKYDKNIHELQRSINSAKLASPTAKATANTELEKMKVDTQATIALITRLRENLRATGAEYQELVQKGEANSSRAKKLLNTMGAQEVQLKQTMTASTLAFAQQGKVVASMKDELTKLDRLQWFKNIAARASAYFGLYQMQQLVTGAFREELRYLVEVDKSARMLSAVSDVRGNYNERLEAGMVIERQLINLTKQYGGELREVNSAALELTRAGTNSKDIEQATKATMLLAKLTGESVATASNAMATYLQVFGELALAQGKTSYSAQELGDKLAYMANQSRMSVQDIGTFSNYALATATAVGFTVDAIGAMAIGLSNAGFNASTAGTQVRKFSTLLTSSSGEVKDFFDALGVSQSSLADAISKGGTASNEAFVGLLQQMTKISNTEFNTMISGMDLLERNILVALRANASVVIRELDGMVTKSAGTLDKSKAVVESYEATWQRAKVALLETGREGVEPLADSVQKLTQFLLENGAAVKAVAQIIVGVVAAIGGAAAIAAISAAIAAATPVIVALGAALAIVAPSLVGAVVATNTLTEAQERLKVSTEKYNKIVLNKELTTQLVQDAYNLQKTGELTEDVLVQIATTIKNSAQEFANAANLPIDKAYERMMPTDQLEGAPEAFKEVFSRITGVVVEQGVIVSDTIVSTFKNLIKEEAIKGLKESMSRLVSAVDLGNFMDLSLVQGSFDKQKDKLTKGLDDLIKYTSQENSGGGLTPIVEGLKELQTIDTTDIAKITTIFQKIENSLPEDAKFASVRRQVALSKEAFQEYATKVVQANNAVAKNIDENDKKILNSFTKQETMLSDTFIGDKVSVYSTLLTALDEAKHKFKDISTFEAQQAEYRKKLSEANLEVQRQGIAIEQAKNDIISRGDEVGRLTKNIALLEEKKKLTSSLSEKQNIELDIMQKKATLQDKIDDTQLKKIELAVSSMKADGDTLVTQKKILEYYEQQRGALTTITAQAELDKKIADQKAAIVRATTKDILAQVDAVIAKNKNEVESLRLEQDKEKAHRAINEATQYYQGLRTDLLESENAYANVLGDIVVTTTAISKIEENIVDIKAKQLLLKGKLNEGKEQELTNKLKEQENNLEDEKLKQLQLEEQRLRALRKLEEDRIKNSDDFVAGWKLANSEFLRNQQTVAEAAMSIHAAMTDAMTDGFMDFFDATSDGYLDLEKLAKNVANSIAREMLKTLVVNPIASVASGLVSSAASSFFDSIFSGWSGGGYTYSSPRDTTPVGVVHANEYVIPADMVRRHPSLVQGLEAERRGFRGFMTGGDTSDENSDDDGGYGGYGGYGDDGGYGGSSHALNADGNDTGGGIPGNYDGFGEISTGFQETATGFTFDGTSIIGNVIGAVLGGVLGGPLGAAIGGALGKGIGMAIDGGATTSIGGSGMNTDGNPIGVGGLFGVTTNTPGQPPNGFTIDGTAILGKAGGAILGGLALGPLGAALGGALGGALGTAIDGGATTTIGGVSIGKSADEEATVSVGGTSYSSNTDATLAAINSSIGNYASGELGEDDRYKFTGSTTAQEIADIIINDGIKQDVIAAATGIYKDIFSDAPSLLEGADKDWLTLFNAYAEKGNEALLETVLDGSLFDTPNFYKIWETYAKDLDITVSEALAQALGSMKETKRDFELWKTGRTDPIGQLGLEAQYAKDDVEKLADSFGITGVTVENFSERYSEAIKKSLDPTTIERWNALGAAIIADTDAADKLANALRQDTATKFNKDYANQLTWNALIETATATTVTNTNATSSATNAVNSMTEAANDYVNTLEASIGIFDNVITALAGAIEDLQSEMVDGTTYYNRALYEAKQAELALSYENIESMEAYEDAVAKVISSLSNHLKTSNYSSERDYVFAKAIAIKELSELQVQTVTERDLLQDVVDELKISNANTASTANNTGYTADNTQSLGTKIWQLTTAVIAGADAQVLTLNSAIQAIKTSTYTIILGASAEATLFDIFEDLKGFESVSAKQLQDGIFDIVNGVVGALDTNSNGIYEIIRGINAQGENLLLLDPNEDGIIDTVLKYDASGKLTEIATNTKDLVASFDNFEGVKTFVTNNIIQNGGTVSSGGSVSFSPSVSNETGIETLRQQLEHYKNSFDIISNNQLHGSEYYRANPTEWKQLMSIVGQMDMLATNMVGLGDTRSETTAYTSIYDQWKEWAIGRGLPVYATGGYTGDGGKYDIAGVVHKGEYVVNSKTTKDLGLNNSVGIFKDILGELRALKRENTDMKSLLIKLTADNTKQLSTQRALLAQAS